MLPFLPSQKKKAELLMPSGNEEIKFQQNCWQPTAISQKQTPAANENTVILETDEPSVPHQDTAFLQD